MPLAPGDYLRSELERRSWTQAQFAEILDRPVQFVNDILAGKKEITRVSAAQLGAALDTSAEFWLHLQDDYLLWKQGQDGRLQQQFDGIRARAHTLMERKQWNRDHEEALREATDHG
jgi:HTH-type transcriptional regulator/antitoxin HigA